MMLNHADAFFQAGSRCAANIAITPERATCPHHPVIVNYSFAIEIYLKVILVCQGTFPYSKTPHHLAELFSLISTEEKKIISREYAENTAELQTVFMQIATYFVDHRYFYENPKAGGIDYRVFVAICEILYRAIRRIKPELMIPMVKENW